MRSIVTALMIAAGATAFVALAFDNAEARAKKSSPRVLTITKRSFLDSGKYPPVGSLQRYVTMDTLHPYPAYYDHRGRYGVETLPGRFGVFSPN